MIPERLHLHLLFGASESAFYCLVSYKGEGVRFGAIRGANLYVTVDKEKTPMNTTVPDLYFLLKRDKKIL